MHGPTAPRRIRFGRFELDVRTGELLKDGRRLRVPDQSIQILQALLERAGDVVTRDELRNRLWPAGTFVDFEHGLNSAVRRLRDVLGDSADKPKLIETLPRRGYRFIGVVEVTDTETTTPAPLLAPIPVPIPTREPDAPQPDTDNAPTHTAAPPSRPRTWWAAAAVAVVLGGVALTVNGTWPRGANAAAAPWSAVPTRLTFEDGLQTDPSFSPDGQSLAYAGNAAGNFDIYRRAVTDADPVPITTHPAHDSEPDWSRDGRNIAFRSERDGGGIFVVPATGGVERKVADFGYRPQWSPDGRSMVFTQSIFVGTVNALHVLDGLGGVPRGLPSGPSGAYGWTPDSRRILTLSNIRVPFVPLMVDVDIATETATEWTVDADVSRRFRDQGVAVAAFEKLQWHGERTLFFIGESGGVRSVWRIEADAAVRRVTGGPDRVTTLPDASNFSLSLAGDRLAFDGSTRAAQLWSHELDDEGRVIAGREYPVSLDAVDATFPAISQDGAWLAFVRTWTAGRRSPALVVRELASGREQPIRDVDGVRDAAVLPRWSQTGDRVSYTYIERSDSGAFRHQLRVFDVASGNDAPLTSGSEDTAIDFAGGWTPGDRFIVANGRGYVESRWAIALLPLDAAPHAERAATIVTSVERGTMYQPTMSPDGRWIAFRAINVPGVQGAPVAIVSADGGDPSRWIIATRNGDKPRWSPQGDRLYFTRNNGAMMNVWSIGFDTVRGRLAGEPRQETAYTDPAFRLLPNLRTLEIGVGGNRLVVPLVRAKGGIWLAERDGR